MNGGRDYWVDNDYPTTDEIPSSPEQGYSAKGPFEDICMYRDDVEKAADKDLPLVDVRSSEEFSGKVLAPLGLQEAVQRGGRIPGVSNVSWVATVNDNDTFKFVDEFRDPYTGQGIEDDESTVACCRIGKRSSAVWLALHELLGYENVTDYDGSWTEWDNLIDTPVERGN